MLHSLLLPEVRALIESAVPSNMGPFDLILPDFNQAANEYPSPEIEQWVLDHPVIEQETARTVAKSLKK